MLTVKVTLPLLVRVEVIFALPEPTSTLPKLRVCGVRETLG